MRRLTWRTAPADTAKDIVPAALANDLERLFSSLANPLGRPPAPAWAERGVVRGHSPAGWSSGTRRRLAGGLAAGVAALLLTAAGYTAVTNTGLADRMFASLGSPSGEAVIPLGASQTSGGVTVTVDHAVFDGRPIEELSGPGGPTVTYVPVMIQYTVSGLPAGARFSIGETVSSGGQELRRAGAVGLGGGTYSEILDRELPPGTQQLLAAYDTTGLDPEAGVLSLRLDVTVTPRGEPITHDGEPSNPGEVVPLERPGGAPLRFVFDVAVPVK